MHPETSLDHRLDTQEESHFEATSERRVELLRRFRLGWKLNRLNCAVLQVEFGGGSSDSRLLIHSHVLRISCEFLSLTDVTFAANSACQKPQFGYLAAIF